MTLVAFALAAYGGALNLSFVGDDYIFLDKTRSASFGALWSFANHDFGWYRPWAREWHFWLIQKIGGANPTVFRLTGIALWVAALCLYFAVLRRLSSPRVAAIATLGVASLALWGTPLVWISGSQDLWMLCFTMASLLLFVDGRARLALVPFALALLSKETSAVLPAVLCGYVVLAERRPVTDALRRTAPFWLVTAVWLLIHPTLLHRLWAGERTLEVGQSAWPAIVVARSLLSMVNLDRLPRPVETGWADLLGVVVSAAILAAGVVWIAGRRATGGGPPENSRPRADLLRFALLWTVAGWLPLLHASIGWHAYYGCLGVLGAWFALTLWLHGRARTATVAIACLALLQGAQAHTMSWDWGAVWYHQRAGRLLEAIRREIERQHPSLPAHARVYFGNIPNNIGLIAGRSSAIRVWYGDRTLEADFMSQYRPRTASEARGADFFFRFDSLAGMVEVRAGAEDVERAMIENPSWESDHEKLAVLFLQARDIERAAAEFEKLSSLPHRSDAAVFAAACRQVAGDFMAADSLLTEARRRLHLSPAQMDAWILDLQHTFPAPGSPVSSTPGSGATP